MHRCGGEGKVVARLSGQEELESGKMGTWTAAEQWDASGPRRDKKTSKKPAALLSWSVGFLDFQFVCTVQKDLFG